MELHPVEQFILTGQLLTLCSSRIFYSLSTVFIRLSVSLFLIKICLRCIYKVIIYAIMAIVLLFSTFYFFLLLFQCSPVDFFWNGKIPWD
jgi:hypothetical protein